MGRHTIMHICFLLFFVCSAAAAQERDKVIKVSGTGVVSVMPDRARVHMQVSQVDKSVVAAKKAVDEMASQIQKMLLDQGVKPSDVNASGFSVYEERNEPINRDRKQEGYRVSREMVVKVEDISRLDVILDHAINLGTNRVQNIEFYSSGMADIKYEALQKASEDAGKKAEFLAKQFGCRVGKPQQIEYDYSGREPQPYAFAAARAGAPAFLQGTIDVTATVNVVYQIEQGTP